MEKNVVCCKNWTSSVFEPWGTKWYTLSFSFEIYLLVLSFRFDFLAFFWHCELNSFFCSQQSRTGVPQGTLCLQDCVVERIQNCISFKSPSREYIFRPETAEVLNRWMLALRQLCGVFFVVIPWALKTTDKNGKVRHHSFHRTSFRVPSECSSCVKVITTFKTS